MEEYEARGQNFAIGTTLASRSLAPRVRRLRESGYEFQRYVAGLKNLFSLYIPLADLWQAYDNTVTDDLQLVAEGQTGQPEVILLPETWKRIKEIADNE
jgi:predicted ABC-type ATPase